MSKLIYLTGPYDSDSPEQRYVRLRRLDRASRLLLKDGVHVVSPQVQHLVSWDELRPLAEFLLPRCDHLMVLTEPGWRMAESVTAEMRIARINKMFINYMALSEDGQTYEVDHDYT